jgi:hypothetical protein
MLLSGIAAHSPAGQRIAVIENAMLAGVVLHDRILQKMNLRPGSGSFSGGYDHTTILRAEAGPTGR